MSIVVVTGTGTEVGKTVATAALAACAFASSGRASSAPGRIAVVKPAQTGVSPDEPGDLAEVARLARVSDTFEFARYPDPLSPHHAARVSGLPELDFAETVTRIADLDARFDLVLVEGAGGLLVPFTSSNGWTLADLATSLHAGALLVTAAGLGTINHTALTVERLADEHIPLLGMVIGSWPVDPDLATRCTVADLAAMAPGGELAGVLPAGMSTMRDFRRQARASLVPQWGGTFDSQRFVAQHGF